jgi:hypothetical protein
LAAEFDIQAGLHHSRAGLLVPPRLSRFAKRAICAEAIPMFTRLAMFERLPRLISMARNNPDYFGAVLTGYVFIGLNVGLQVLLVPLYIHKLGYAEFGVLMILLSFVNFSTVGVYGFAGSVVRALSEHAAAGDMKAFVAAYSAARALLAVYGILLIVAASATAHPHLCRIFRTRMLAARIPVMRLAAISGGSRVRMPYTSQRKMPVVSMTNISKEMSFVERVRHARNAWGTNAVVVRIAARYPMKITPSIALPPRARA